MGKGKSWRTTGILYVRAASSTRGAARAQSGHSRSSKITIATETPFGGRSNDALSCAASSEAIKSTAKNPSFFVINELDAEDPGAVDPGLISMVTEPAGSVRLRISKSMEVERAAGAALYQKPMLATR